MLRLQLACFSTSDVHGESSTERDLNLYFIGSANKLEMQEFEIMSILSWDGIPDNIMSTSPSASTKDL